jgi:hypothetical protein
MLSPMTAPASATAKMIHGDRRWVCPAYAAAMISAVSLGRGMPRLSAVTMANPAY